MGAAGGMLTAWDASICSLGAVSSRPFSLTASFTLSVDAVCFFLTNVYAPSVREDRPAFFSEIASVASTVQGPWMLLGDFNLTRCPDDKNNDCFNASEANRFNDLINSLGSLKSPLSIGPTLGATVEMSPLWCVWIISL